VRNGGEDGSQGARESGGRKLYTIWRREWKNPAAGGAALRCGVSAGPPTTSVRKEVIDMKLKTHVKAGLKAERVQEAPGSY
jgi:hypothetical protein